MRRFGFPVSAVVVSALTVLLVTATPVGARSTAGDADSPGAEWRWPVATVRIVAPYVQPVHRYAAGHRGIDLAVQPGAFAVSPADGVVAFAGEVAGRGIITIDHGDGLITTLEPVVGDVAPGDRVERGDRVGIVSEGGHTAVGSMHFGVRLDGEYINPLVLLGGVPRAVLLPCCN